MLDEARRGLGRGALRVLYRAGLKRLPAGHTFEGQPFAVEFVHSLAKRVHTDYAWDLETARRWARVRCSLAADSQARIHKTTAGGGLGEPVGFYAEEPSTTKTYYDMAPTA